MVNDSMCQRVIDELPTDVETLRSELRLALERESELRKVIDNLRLQSCRLVYVHELDLVDGV